MKTLEKTKTLKVGWPLTSSVFYEMEQVVSRNFQFITQEDMEPLLAAISTFIEKHHETPTCLPDDFEISFSEVLINAVTAQPDAEKYVQIFIFPDGVLIAVDNTAEGADIDKMKAELPIPKQVNGQWVVQDHGRGLFLLTQNCDSVTLRQHDNDIEIIIGYERKE